MPRKRLHLKIAKEDPEVAYLQLSNHAGRGTAGIVKRTLRLHDLIGAYGGADLYFDFDENNQLIGVEILE